MKYGTNFLAFNKKWIQPTVFVFILWQIACYLKGDFSVDGVCLTLYDLRLPLLTAALVLYGGYALPAMILLFIHALTTTQGTSLAPLLAQLLAAACTAFIYFRFTGKRGAVYFGYSKLSIHRISALVSCNTLLFILFQPALTRTFGYTNQVDFFSVHNLINVQGVMNSCLTGIPLCYLLLRSLGSPKWGVRQLYRSTALLREGPRPGFLIIWLLVLVSLIYFFIAPQNGLMQFTDYSILLLMPVILWGILYVGAQLILPVWTLLLVLIDNHQDGYLTPSMLTTQQNLAHQAITSTEIFVFTLTIVVASVLALRNRAQIRKLTRLSLTDPNTGLPNLRALSTDLHRHPYSGLCLVQCPELLLLVQEYGLNIRFEFEKALTRHLVSFLQEDEQVYFYPGYGLFIRPDNTDVRRIKGLYHVVKYFRFSWNKQQLGLNCGLGFTFGNSSLDSILFTAGQLSRAAMQSLKSGQPEVMCAKHEQQHDESVISTVQIRHLLQETLDRQSFVLVAQPIVSTRGHAPYHEILIRMRTADNTLIFPDTFLPVARNADITTQVDMVVIEQTLRFMLQNITKTVGQQFSINLMSQTLCRAEFIPQVTALFKQYRVAPERIIFEVIESDIFDITLAIDTLQRLRQLGCKIAIDDFGTGYASQSRLKNLDADILKIDGSFVRNILQSKFDHYTVESFCKAAHIKRMQVVAEYVEDEAIKQELEKIGVDWLQGYHTGRPEPLENLTFKSVSRQALHPAGDEASVLSC